MTRSQRFMAALRLLQPDQVPMFDYLYQEPMYEALIGHRPGKYNARDAIACALALDHDGVYIPFVGHSGFQPKRLDENVWRYLAMESNFDCNSMSSSLANTPTPSCSDITLSPSFSAWS